MGQKTAVRGDASCCLLYVANHLFKDWKYHQCTSVTHATFDRKGFVVGSALPLHCLFSRTNRLESLRLNVWPMLFTFYFGKPGNTLRALRSRWSNPLSKRR